MLSPALTSTRKRFEWLMQPPRRKRNVGQEALEDSVRQSPWTPGHPQDEQSTPTAKC